MSTLAELNPGESATITGLHFEPPLRARLAALGFRVGRRVALVRRACCHGPLQVRIGSTDVMLRDREASRIAIVRR